MKYTIYKITNSENNKVYIGLTRNYPQRWANHWSKINNKLERLCINRKFLADNNKYPNEAYLIEEIEITKSAKRERFWIKQYNSITTGYNIDKGQKRQSKKTKKTIKIPIIKKTNKQLALEYLKKERIKPMK